MTMFRRGMTFLAFLGSCIAVGLLIASLGTKRWLVAGAKRSSNPVESDGRIHFGLFDGRKELNVAYGWRAYDIDVVRQLRYEPELQIYGLWLGTVMGVCGALLMAAIGGVAAAIVAASNKYSNRCCCLVGGGGGVARLYLWNTLALLCSLSAIGCFVAQYYLRLRNNVLTREDRDNLWSSEGRAQLGYSFWAVVGAAAACFVNLLTVWVAASTGRSTNNAHHHQFVNNALGPMLEEKANGAIMLY